jgi:hypothetical protein
MCQYLAREILEHDWRECVYTRHMITVGRGLIRTEKCGPQRNFSCRCLEEHQKAEHKMAGISLDDLGSRASGNKVL